MPASTIALMKNTTHNNCFNRAESSANFAGSKNRTAMSAAALVVLLGAVFSTSGCVGTVGALKGASSQQSTPGAAAISVAPAAIKFGSVALGSTASQSVTVTNGGGSSVTITKASAAGAGVTITGGSFPMMIEAGKQFTFNVVFAPKAAGALAGDVAVVSDLSSTPSMVSVTGTGMAATSLLTTTTSSLSFGSVTIGKSSVLSVTLTNAGNSDVTVSKVSASGAGYSQSGVSAGLILAPGQSATLDETFIPASAGNFAGSVAVVSNATNSPATISLSGAGTQSAAHSVELAWTASTSAVAGYDVFRSVVSGGPYAKLDSSTVTADSFTDSTVQAGQTYYYVVTSVSSSGVESADSLQAAATVPAS